MRFIKIFFVSVSQPARRAANTLPISWERIFMLVIPKIFLVTIIARGTVYIAGARFLILRKRLCIL